MLIMYWYTGRDVIPNMPVAVEWSPPKNLSPAEVGTLVDERCDMTDIVSTLIDLAARGYLKIRQTIANDMLFFSKHNYVFTKLPEPKNDAKLLPYEKIFLNGLFENAGPDGTVYLSDLKEKFYVHLTGIECAIYDSLVQKGMFLQSPRNVRHSWQGIGILLLFCALFGAALHVRRHACPHRGGMCGAESMPSLPEIRHPCREGAAARVGKGRSDHFRPPPAFCHGSGSGG